MTTRSLKYWCLLLLAMLLTAACRQQTAPATNGGGQQALSPDDSAAVLMELVDHYYKNVEHDSLYNLAPQAMAFNSIHGQWKNYYTTWCLLVNDLVWNGQMEKGFKEARKMHQDAIKRNNAFGLSEAYTAMGIAYHFQGNNKESAESYQQALAHFPADADQSVKLNIYSYYCQVLVDAKEYEAMGRVLSEWRIFLDQLTGGDIKAPGNAHKYFRFHRENYKYHFALGRYRLASSELDVMQRFLEKENDRELYEAQVAGFRMQIAMAKRDYNAAMSWSDVEIELCRKQDFNTFLNALRHRTEVLQTLGHYEEALRAYRSYDQQKDSIIKAGSRKQLNELNKCFQVDELKAQQERDQLEHERSQLMLLLILATVIVVALVLFSLFRYHSARRLQAAYRKLEESNTQLSALNVQLTTANARAEESSKMKSLFIQQISHEIRTPLNVLSGFTQIVTTPDMELDDETKQNINLQITENTNRITGLVNKMLELSDASSKTVIQRNDTVPAIQIAAQAIDQSGIANAAHLDFDLQMDETAEAAMLTTNLNQATRALSLLLDNARKFTRPAEAHHRHKQVEQKQRAVLRLTVAGGWVKFTVEDTGIGVPAGEAEHIFDEFVQLDEYYDGTGIGLTVARSIARRLGGDVTIDTNYGTIAHKHQTDGEQGGSGARFIMTLPM